MRFYQCMAAIAAATMIAQPAATATTVTLGQQDYGNGANTNFGNFNAASDGEPAPFDTFRGDDNSVPFSADFTFLFAPSDISSAQVTFGIFDSDTAVAGSQLASFSVNGIDLTAALNAVFEANPSDDGQVGVYSLTLPASTYAALGSGSAAFSLALQGPVDRFLPGNGAGLDFAQFDFIGTPRSTTPAVPEPSSWALMALGLGAVVLRRRAVTRRG